MARDSHALYEFAAGVNYRDEMRAYNELSEVENLRWYEGGLSRRGGYALRASTLSCSAAFGTAGDCLSIVDHLHHQWGTANMYFLFVSVDSGGGSVADKVVVMHNASGVPTSAVAFTCLGSGDAITWDAAKPFGVKSFRDKIHIVSGQDDPHVLMYGSAWTVNELIICKENNASASNGWGTAANYIIDNDTWNGCQWVDAVENYLYVGDNETMYFAPCPDPFDDPGEDADGTAGAARTAIIKTWGATFYKKLNLDSEIYRVKAYKSYLMMGSRKNTWRWLNRDYKIGDYYFDKILDSGVRSNICATPNGAFWVGEDAIYYHDGVKTHDISGKIWTHIEAQHTTLPGDLEDASVVYHKGWVWITFPNSTDKEVWVFNPRSIYQDVDGNLYAPFFKMIYKVTDLDTKKDFWHFRSYDSKLYATDGAEIFELETGCMDDAGSNEIGINTEFETADMDFEMPNRRKVYGKMVLETEPNLEVLLTHAITFSRDYGEATASAAGIDTTYTGAQRAHIELDIPYTVDGNALKVNVTGDASGMSASGAVRYYGLGIEVASRTTTKKEVS